MPKEHKNTAVTTLAKKTGGEHALPSDGVQEVRGWQHPGLRTEGSQRRRDYPPSQVGNAPQKVRVQRSKCLPDPAGQNLKGHFDPYRVTWPTAPGKKRARREMWERPLTIPGGSYPSTTRQLGLLTAHLSGREPPLLSPFLLEDSLKLKGRVSGIGWPAGSYLE